MSRAAQSLCLVGGLAGMAWLNWQWLYASVDISAIESRTPGAIMTKNGGTGAVVASGDLYASASESLSRPLFHSDRKPFEPLPPVQIEAVAAEEPPTVIDPAQAVQAPGFRLAGVSLFGAEQRALLGRAESAELRWYSLGDDLDGWTVAAVTNDAATLAAGDLAIRLPLYPSISDSRGN